MCMPISLKSQFQSFLTSEITQQAGLALLLRAFGIGMGFLAHAILAKGLGASSYGDYALVITIVSIFSAFCLQGFDLSAQKFIPFYKTQDKQQDILGFTLYSTRQVFTFSIASSFLLAASSFLPIWNTNLRSMFYLASLLLIFTAMMQHLSSILRAHKKVLQALIPLDAIRTILLVSIGSTILFWPEFSSSFNAILLTLFSSIVCFVITLLLFLTSDIKNKETTPQFGEKINWSKVSKPIYISALLGLMQTQIDILLVSFFTNSEDVGVYSLSSRIAALVWLGGYAVSSVSGAIMSEMLAMPEGKTKLQHLFRTIALGQIIYTTPIASVLLYSGMDLLSYFGSEYSNGFVPLVILTVAFSVASLSGPVGILMNVAGYQRHSMTVSAIAVLLQILLSILLIPVYGIVGAASATAFCFVGRILVMLIIIRIKLGINCSIFYLLKNES